MSKQTKQQKQEVVEVVEVVEEEQEEEEEEETESSQEDQMDEFNDQERIPIDLSENEVYRGICTLFEDEDGNNILEYISLLHSELIGHNKTMKSIKKDLSRIADCAEIMAKKMK